MILTLEQIKDEIGAGRVSAISIDTSIIDAQQRSFEYGLLKRLRQFAGSHVKVVLTDVVIQEIEAHIRKDALEAQASFNKALKGIGQTWQVSIDERDVVTTLLYGTDSAESIAKKRIENFIAATNAVIPKAKDHVAVGDLVDRYFAPHPPFSGKETKKYEFPDALALLTLESWAAGNDTNVLVATKDSDWKQYCANSARLVAIDDLAEALGCFQREVAIYKCKLLSRQVLSDDPLGIKNKVESAINMQSWKIEFIPEMDSQFYCENDDIEAEFQLSDFHQIFEGQVLEPVEYEDDNLVVRLMADSLVEVTGHFSFAHWDSIDKEYMSMGNGSATTREFISIEVLVTFSWQAQGQVEIDEIEVLPKREHLSFGEIEPDWMSDPDNLAINNRT